MAVVVAATGLVGAPARAVCARIQDHDVPVPEGIVVPDAHVRVILPVRYCDEGDDREYPVLYLLHGAGDTWRTWTENTDVEGISAAHDVIVVMPDGGRSAEAGWYSDWADGSRQWETFHTDVLVSWVDDTFRTLDARRHRAVAGLSMGGFGAMSYAARHPDLFAAAASFSGAVDTMYGWPASGFFFEALHDQFGTPDDRVWGDHVADEPEWRAHNPTDLAARLGGTELFVTTGTGTPGGHAGDDPSNPGGYGLEQFIFQMNASFAVHLDLAGVDHTDWFYPGGYHGWPYWESALEWSLPKIEKVIGKTKGKGNGKGNGKGRAKRAAV